MALGKRHAQLGIASETTERYFPHDVFQTQLAMTCPCDDRAVAEKNHSFLKAHMLGDSQRDDAGHGVSFPPSDNHTTTRG